ncbi:hypothetical protein GCM10011411_15480 [Aurantiacibacter arachoides]|nr:hypothetical protein GCM10011411_15480 [Aurantiacibacter arachoides]
MLGVVAGEAVDFTKTYARAGFGYENPVDYVGRVTDDGNRITGVWSLRDMNGSFEMIHHAAREEAEEREAAEELTLSVRS